MISLGDYNANLWLKDTLNHEEAMLLENEVTYNGWYIHQLGLLWNQMRLPGTCPTKKKQ